MVIGKKMDKLYESGEIVGQESWLLFWDHEMWFVFVVIQMILVTESFVVFGCMNKRRSWHCVS